MRLINRTLALESRFFDSLTASGASASLDEVKLDVARLQALEQHENLLQALDNWVLAPDKRLYPQLLQLATVVRKLYPLGHRMQLYRGFDPQSPYQNTMGLSERGFLSNSEKPFKVGETHTYTCDDAPLSFSTDPGIARAFGKVVVRAIIDPQHTNALVITPELAALVSKRRNIKPETQHEVIVLPHTVLHFVIDEIR